MEPSAFMHDLCVGSDIAASVASRHGMAWKQLLEAPWKMTGRHHQETQEEASRPEKYVLAYRCVDCRVGFRSVSALKTYVRFAHDKRPLMPKGRVEQYFNAYGGLE